VEVDAARAAQGDNSGTHTGSATGELTYY